MRNRSRLFVSRVSGVLAGLVVAGAWTFGCGGGTARVATPASTADGGTEGGLAELATSPPPSGLPPMATMPPPGVAGSKKARRRLDPAHARRRCTRRARARAKDPAEIVKQIGEGCAAASKMKPISAMLRGQQGDKDAHQESKLRAEANHCYRVYFAGDDAVKDMVVVLRDSAGDIIAESPGPAAPDGGAACFDASDEVSVLVSVGSGKGAWAAQVWGD